MEGNYIKVNVPDTKAKEKAGNGEGCWFIVSDEVKKFYDEDVAGVICEGILDNDSYYYPKLKAGEVLRFQMRGDKRPVVNYEDLQQFR